MHGQGKKGVRIRFRAFCSKNFNAFMYLPIDTKKGKEYNEPSKKAKGIDREGVVPGTLFQRIAGW